MTNLSSCDASLVGIARPQFRRLHGDAAETVETHLPVSEVAVGEVLYWWRTEVRRRERMRRERRERREREEGRNDNSPNIAPHFVSP